MDLIDSRVSSKILAKIVIKQEQKIIQEYKQYKVLTRPLCVGGSTYHIVYIRNPFKVSTHENYFH